MALVTISLRIPKSVNEQLEAYVAENGYATKTEVIRDWMRQELAMAEIRKTRGALKGKGIKMPESMTAWRKKEWERLLKRAGQDPFKAVKLMEQEARESLGDLSL